MSRSPFRASIAVPACLAIATLVGAQAIPQVAHAQSVGLERYRALAELAFESDYPTEETLQALEDELYFERAVQVYHWALPAMNMFAMKEGAADTYAKATT